MVLDINPTPLILSRPYVKSEKNINLLRKNVDEIFHCAASTKFNLPLTEIRKINVNGTKNILDLASLYNKKAN